MRDELQQITAWETRFYPGIKLFARKNSAVGLRPDLAISYYGEQLRKIFLTIRAPSEVFTCWKLARRKFDLFGGPFSQFRGADISPEAFMTLYELYHQSFLANLPSCFERVKVVQFGRANDEIRHFCDHLGLEHLIGLEPTRNRSKSQQADPYWSSAGYQARANALTQRFARRGFKIEIIEHCNG